MMKPLQNFIKPLRKADMGRMKCLTSIAQVRRWREECRRSGLSVGFVPTMGSLHEGHRSLITKALEENDRTIVSIFVNPAQFAPHEDFEVYPRSTQLDLQSLSDPALPCRAHAVFLPDASELYPFGIPLDQAKQIGAFVNVQGLSSQLEGQVRPHFFRGVATVVTKLLNIVQPERIYFGQKDAQQCVVVKALVKDLHIDTSVKVVPTMREENGLAMSSRNAYLSADVRSRSCIINMGLQEALASYKLQVSDSSTSVLAQPLIDAFKNRIATEPDFVVEYATISHPETLQNLLEINLDTAAYFSVAVKVPRAGDGKEPYTRLIDNIILH